MDPITLIAGATTIVKALGLDERIGKLLAGDRGAQVATKVTKIAQEVTGASDMDGALLAINRDAEAAMKLQMRLIDVAAEEDARAVADRADARAMQVAALGQEDLMAKRFVYWFAAAWSLFAMAYLTFITFVDFPLSNQRFADTILGFLLGTIIATIIVYFFGSSKGSHGKDNALNGLIEAMREKNK